MGRVSDCTWVNGLDCYRLGLVGIPCILMEKEEQDAEEDEEEELQYVV